MNLPTPPQVRPVQRLSFTKTGRVVRAYQCINLNPHYVGEPMVSSKTGEFSGYVEMRIKLLHGANYNEPGYYTSPVGDQGCHILSNQQMGSGSTAMAACLAGGSFF